MDKVKFQVIGTPLIKFQSKERIDSFRKGLIYANRLSYYRKLEQTTGDIEVGDSYEAMLHLNEAYIHGQDTGETVHIVDGLIPTTHSDDYIFCMFGIYPKLDNFSFSKEQKEKMVSFGDTALIIKDSEKFIRRVKSAAEKKGYKCKFEAVQYYDPTYDNGNQIISIMSDMSNIAFWKRDFYKYQQEARFLFTGGDMSLDHLEIEIGDISDISEIVPSEMALTAMVIKQK